MNDNDSKGILATVEAMLEGREYSMWSAPLAGWLYWSKYAVVLVPPIQREKLT